MSSQQEITTAKKRKMSPFIFGSCKSFSWSVANKQLGKISKLVWKVEKKGSK